MPAFYCNARYFLVTYAQCGDLSEWSVLDRFTTLGAECIIAREEHNDLGLHFHVFADFGRKFRSRKTDVFDVDGRHANIKPSRGGNGRDWNNFFTAPLDPTRISVQYDKTISIQSGNQAGRNVVYNRWHPMNKNLVYDDDENGQETEPSGNSTRGKPGMGDYYVIDMFTSGTPISTETSGMSFSPEATLYWHEK
jgi:hypothetical protein